MTELRRTERAHDELRVDASGGLGLQTSLLDSRSIVDVMDDGVLVFDPLSGHILDANRGAAKLLGHDLSALLSSNFWRLSGTLSDTAEELRSARDREGLVETTFATGKGRFEARYLRPDGRRVWCEVRLLRWEPGDARSVEARGSSARERRMVAILRDIEDIKAAREAARVSDERYRGLVKNLPKSAIMLCDHDLRLVLVDGPEIGLSGLTKQDIEGRTIHESLPPDFVALIEGNMRRVLAGESFSAEIPFGPLWYTYNYLPIFDDEGTRVLYGMILAVNITERRNAEEALRKSEERFMRIFQASADAILVTHQSTGRIVEVNDSFTSVTGWARAEALDKTTIELGMWTDPSAREAVLDEMCRASGPGSVEYHGLLCKDGTQRDGTVSLRRIELDGVPCNLFAFRDTTEHRQVELERERLITELTARNAEMEEFTFTVSHDLKSPLVTITGFLGMLERDLEADNKEGVRSDIARIGSAANKMLGLLSDLLELSRVGRTNNAMEDVSLSEVMRDALELLSGPLAERNVEVVLAPNLPAVHGDRVRLAQVAQNLLENAVKYMGDQPHPRIEIGMRPDPRYEVCFIKDNGVGVDCRYVERIFGLFEKLNPRSEGSGVGLALVRRILESHGGSVWVESGSEERGSTFVFRIPRRAPGTKPSTPPGGLV